MKTRNILLLAFLAVFFLCSWTDWGHAEENNGNSLQVEVMKKDDEYEFLKEQTKDFQEHVKEELTRHREFVEGEWDRLISFLTIIGYVLGFVLLFIFGSSWLEFRKTIKSVQEEALLEYKRVMEKKIEDFKIEIQQTKKEFEKSKDEIYTELESNMRKTVQKEVEALRSIIEQEMRYRNAKILITGSENQLDDMSKYIDDAMKLRGLEKPEYLKLPEDINNKHLKELEEKLEGIDVLVYHFTPNYDQDKKMDYDKRLEKILDILKKASDNDLLFNIPFIIYTYGYNERVKQDTNKYRWSFLANSPATLMGHIYTNIHTMILKKENE